MEKLKTWWNAVHTFYDEVRMELKKCSWPSWPELKESTVVVIVSVVILGVFVGFTDLLLNGLLKLVIR